MKKLLGISLVFALTLVALPAQHTLSETTTAGAADELKPWPPHGDWPNGIATDSPLASEQRWPPHWPWPTKPANTQPELQAQVDWPPHWPWPDQDA